MMGQITSGIAEKKNGEEEWEKMILRGMEARKIVMRRDDVPKEEYYKWKNEEERVFMLRKEVVKNLFFRWLQRRSVARKNQEEMKVQKGFGRNDGL